MLKLCNPQAMRIPEIRLFSCFFNNSKLFPLGHAYVNAIRSVSDETSKNVLNRHITII